ncbi:glucan 1,3-beta-glucosidase [Saccharomycopsis crataegensis]|uniref:glucan 1,3-beta-glucosidase n=1 Tax=Saccharomycopsis crataegensis TaxID=43959 RepID=A0AAV5QFH5_9ASCO|nr:glucan 1,3-beta-glucosidase [Saccharomycopsis crataegensis]
MRSFILLTLLISTVTAIGDLAFNLGVEATDGSCKTAADYKQDFASLSPYSKIVRFYSASTCNTLSVLGPAAEDAGFEYFIGIWPTDSSHFAAEKSALTNELPNLSVSSVKGITVGSEALYRNDLSPSALASAITEIKDLIKDIKDKDGNSYSSVPVGTVDSWNIMVDGSSEPVIQAADMVFVNAFSYWQGQTMANSSYSFIDDIMQALQVIQTTKGTTDLTFWVGETGWATQGSAYESATPNTSNAAQYWQDAVCGIRAWGINVISFEAFDESWKPDTSGTNDVEKYWGVFDSSRNLKYKLTCDFD